MKISNLTTKVLLFNDLGSYIKGVSPILRSIRLDPIGTAGATKYLLETSEVLLSAQAGDIYRFAHINEISVNDTIVLGAGGPVVLTHNFGILPQVTVGVDAGGGVVNQAVIVTDYTVAHNAAYTITTITFVGAGTYYVRLS